MNEILEDDAPLTHTEQAMAYYGNDLTPAEKVTFEAHLAGCAECQALLADAQRLLPRAEALLAATAAFKPKYTVEEQVRRFDQMVAAERVQRRRRWRLATYALAVGVAVMVGIAALNALRSPPRPAQTMYAP